jgi:histidinol dehydrogenase
MDDMEVPASVQERITAMFGEPLTPRRWSTASLRDIRDRGDAALAEWTEKLDGRKFHRASACRKRNFNPRLTSCRASSAPRWNWPQSASAAFTRPNQSRRG